MDADDQDLFIVRAIEDADSSALGQAESRTPEEVVIQFGGAGVLEAEDLTALRIDAGEHMTDDAVLTRGVHGLQDEEHRVAVISVVHALQRIELFGVPVQDFAVLRLRGVKRSPVSGLFSKRYLFPFGHTERAGID